MSSRRADYGCRNGSSPSVRYPRRSSRERQAIYMSLDENFLLGNAASTSLLRSLVDQANKSRDSINNSYILPHTATFRYSTRSKDRIYLDPYGVAATNEQTDDDEDFENHIVHQKFRKKPRSKPSSPVDEENSPSSDWQTEDRRHIRSNSTMSNTNNVKQEVIEPNMYESVKQRRQAMRQAASVTNQEKTKNSTPCSAVRRRPSKKEYSDNAENDRRKRPTEEDEDSDENEPRHYALRRRINPVTRFHIEPHSARSYAFRRDLSNDGTSRAGRHIKRKNLLNRSDSTSSSSSTDETVQENDDTHYGSHRLRRVPNAKSKIRPINEDDLSYTIGVRELIRRKTGSGNAVTDISPMQVDRTIDFNKVGGLEHHIQSLKEVVLFPLLYGEVFAKFNIQPPKGVLFYGPPGTGKTLVARALANACSSGDKKVAFFMRKGADCLRKWVGESERQLRVLFEQAYSMRPSIIFFDEIDGLAPVRSSKQDQIHSSIVSTLLALMDGLDNRGEVIVIGATNRLDAIDPALRRPGRFDRELCFRLPDKNARIQILKIHTSSWDANRPSDELMDWLSERTSGYCGADLKSLCTEAVLISLRSRFPQVYTSNQKICIDPNVLKVDKKNFELAMRRIVPAGRRDFSIPSRILDDRLKLLLDDVIMGLIKNCMPSGYLGTNKRNEGSSEKERILNAVHSNDVVPSARLLLYGASSDMGQTSYILPVIINRLDHLPIFSLSLANLYCYGLPEERFSYTLQSAVRSSASGTPCILLIPSIDKWYSSIPTSVWNLLLCTLDSFTGSTSVLVLATAECSYTKLPSELRHIFRAQNAVEIIPPPEDRLDAYFHQLIVEPASAPPGIFDINDYPELPKAEVKQQPERLTDDEIEELKKLYKQYRIEIVLHYEETIARLCRDRRFAAFAQPVDSEEVPDYYIHIKNPMDLGTMFSKASTYKNPEEFLNDFRLIHRNAVEYNPVTDCEGRQIRIMAKILLDMGHRATLEFDTKFLKRVEEVKGLLKENGINMDDENDGDDHEKKSEKCEGGGDAEIHTNGHPENDPTAEESKISGMKRRGSSACKLPCKRRTVTKTQKKFHPTQSDLSVSQNVVNDGEMGVASNGDQFVSESDEKDCDNNSDSNSSTAANRMMEVKIDLNKLNEVVELAVKKSRGWPLVDLERFATAITEKLSTYQDEWDRTKLPAEIEEFINGWNPSK